MQLLKQYLTRTPNPQPQANLLIMTREAAQTVVRARQVRSVSRPAFTC